MSETPLERERERVSSTHSTIFIHSHSLLHKMNMVFFLSIAFYLLLCFTAKCQEPLQFAALRPPSSAVHVEPQHLNDVSGSILAAESWLRNNVLAHYPSTNITTIVVGSAVLCRGNQQHNFGLVLPSIKNLHHSLTRWGLHREIQVAAAFSPDCLDPLSESYRHDVVQSHIKPLIAFLRGVAADTPPPEEFLRSSLHSKSMENLGLSEMRVVLSNKRRKLSHKTPTAPSHSPSAPSFALPPLVGTLPPEPEFRAPNIAPTANPASPTYGPHLPPCEPSRSATPPVAHAHHGAWCVAKPSVPAETLQEALDYACGEGEADCEAIKENGDCFFPDSLVAHASYAFNSYWQKTKTNGGSCGFGGTAMLITSDPSYGRCRFSLT